MSEKSDFEVLFYIEKACDTLLRLRASHNFEPDLELDEVIGYSGGYHDETKGEEV